MNEHDHAIIVGIRYYPGINHLSGPVNDAEDFRAWLTSADGGNMNPANIHYITSNYSEEDVKMLATDDALPTREDIKKKFDQLNRNGRLARAAYTEQELKDKGVSYYIDNTDQLIYHGRRLYLFFAGHGFNDKNIKNSISVLAANGDYKELISNGVNAFDCMDFYEQSGYFKEVVLIADCCRVPKLGYGLTTIMVPDPSEPERKIRTAYMLSCQNGQSARETEENGKCNGVFSRLLFDAFKEAQACNVTNAVTYAEINSYIQNNTDKLKGQEAVIHGNSLGHEIKLIERATNAATLLKVKLVFPDKWIGRSISIFPSRTNTLLSGFEITKSEMEVDLPLAILRFELDGPEIKKGVFDSSEKIYDFTN